MQREIQRTVSKQKNSSMLNMYVPWQNITKDIFQKAEESVTLTKTCSTVSKAKPKTAMFNTKNYLANVTKILVAVLPVILQAMKQNMNINSVR